MRSILQCRGSDEVIEAGQETARRIIQSRWLAQSTSWSLQTGCGQRPCGGDLAPRLVAAPVHYPVTGPVGEDRRALQPDRLSWHTASRDIRAVGDSAATHLGEP